MGCLHPRSNIRQNELVRTQSLLERLLNGNYLAEEYPLQWEDDRGVYSTDRARFFDEASSLIPELELPLRPDVAPAGPWQV
jgi:hypothetical protein